MTTLYGMISDALRQNASDIHLTVGLPPVFRIDGQLVFLEEAIMEDADTRGATEELCTPEQLQMVETILKREQ